MEILRCEAVTKVYGRGANQVKALDGVSLSIEKGEFVAVVGASGSGKSTLLHLMGGVDQPTEGRVFVEDEDISTLNPVKAAVFRRRKVGLIYQFYNLIPTLSVEQNIKLPMLLDKRRPDEAYFRGLVAGLGLEDKLKALPGALSGGQQQRTAIARSLLYRPAVVLADEPTGNLDRQNSRQIVELLKGSNRDLGQTIVIITHDERIALEADRVVQIEDGRIVSDRRTVYGVRYVETIFTGLYQAKPGRIYFHRGDGADRVVPDLGNQRDLLQYVGGREPSDRRGGRGLAGTAAGGSECGGPGSGGKL